MRQIQKEFNGLSIVYDASEPEGERWGIMNDGVENWERASILSQTDTNANGTATCVVVQRNKIDIRGLNQEEQTLLFSGATVQEPYFYTMEVRLGGSGLYVAAPAGNGMFVSDIILNCPLPIIGETYDQQVASYYISLVQPGFAYSAINFENITFAQTRQYAMSTLTGAWNSPEEITRNLLGSGAANAGEYIYCYRMFIVTFNGLAPADDARVVIPPARHLLGGTVKEEKDYVRMMRLARQYEPWQRLDRD